MNKMTVSLAMVLAAMCVFCLGTPATAAERASEAECIAKCKAAAAMVEEIGLEATLKKVADKNGPFVWKDTYIFCTLLSYKSTIAQRNSF